MERGLIAMATTKKTGSAGQAGLAQRASGVLSKQGFTRTVGALDYALLQEFPAGDADEWDRTGLLVGDPARLVEGVVVALDPTVEAVEETVRYGANVLVTHHPAFLAPPESFRPASSVAAESGALVWCAIENGVALLSYHTALDVSERAQQVLPGMLNLTFGSVVEPLADAPEKGYGQLCSVRTTDGPFSLGQLAARCTSVFGRAPRVWGDFGRALDNVVTCTGSAGELGRTCLGIQADCLVCGEIKYHEALALSQAGLAIIELGHDTSELPLTAVLVSALEAASVPQELIVVADQGDNWTYPESMRV